MEKQIFRNFTKKLAAKLLPARDPDGHKGDFGRVSITGGSVGFTGAPVLAAYGAARSGSGLVFLGVPEPIYPIVAGHCLEVMPSPLPAARGKISKDAFFPILERLNGCDAGLLGPGLGRSQDLSKLMSKILEETETPLVIDADGLYAIKDRRELLQKRAERGLLTILTPHEGEFRYLSGDLAPGREAAALDFAKEYGCILVLKGPETVTALPDGSCYVNTTGNNGMAKGGSGDVLGGMILGLLGQLVASKRSAEADTDKAQFSKAGISEAGGITALAVYLHGLAGDIACKELGEYGMLPSDLAARIPAAILEVQKNQSQHF
ncbi:NAD(P)H-hydrate dehydratase [Anaerosacchariphilus sp. NSJ-68]|uniref:ADP-dependent (S)-NAD(P)H-hydrate dehydratase n=2 Tax=Lachnospiraceae TaxID=186803 RepID=A0A923RLW7_9FIRM|nr:MULTISPECIES: NAD(P)H-hydrate dehydratase [Lachnospiraceae]MBC5659678.1 NAD(P)H-hydrate dehydratase [Anaerosacchariphilus hominis]MBC5697344.1 NAD(P)H-hydrate dehydratase [Roseburia difficilis]